MELKEINKKAKAMLANFVDEIGLDGESYIEANGKTPVAFGKVLIDALGEYMTPESRRLKTFLEGKKIEPNAEKVISNRGLILLNEKYKEKEPDADLFVTLIHETLHANRNLLIRDAYRDEDFSAFAYSDGKLEQNTDNLATMHADASQDILKGSIDNSKNTIEKYKQISGDKAEEIIDLDEIAPEQMERQKVVDESLVEIISALAYNLYNAKELGKETDIWKQLEKIKEKAKGTDIGYMSEIIIKHKDLELFNWMLDPITYSAGDIHYDFFGNYTQNDKELVDKLYSSERPDLEKDFGALLGKSVRDNEELSKDMYESKRKTNHENISKDMIK